VITLNTAALFFMPTLGLQTAGSVLVGQKIGALDLNSAKRYQRLTQILGICLAIFLGGVILVFRELIAEAYTNVQEVIEETT